MTMANDAAAAYQAGLRYWITGDTAFADAAIKNMDGYANGVQYLTGDSNVLLMRSPGLSVGQRRRAAAGLPTMDRLGRLRPVSNLPPREILRRPANGNGLPPSCNPTTALATRITG